MEQIKQAIAVIKNRWQEVVLVLGLFVIGSIATALVGKDLFAAIKAQQAGENVILENHVFFFVLFSAIVTIISFMLFIGFVRTVFQGSEEQTPGELLKAGKRFFWRIFGFFLLYSLALIVLLSMVSTVAESFLHAKGGEGIDLNLSRACAFLTMLILIKPAILIPAVIITLDCGIIKSIGYLSEVKLTQSKELIVLFCLQALIVAFFSFNEMDKTTLYYVLDIIPNTLIYFIRLIIFIIAVRLVSSYNLQIEPETPAVTSDQLIDE